MTAPTQAAPLLLMEGIEKSFPGVRAIKHGRLELRSGEIHALVGENGAGKSTLIKILAGAHPPDAGSISLQGEPVRFQSPLDAQRAGIAVIFQEFNLVPALSIRENLFLGQECGRWLLPAAEHRRARELCQRLGFDLDPETLCRDLSVAQQQLVEIAKAMAREARILVMDEPTAALSGHETRQLFALMRELRQRGLGVVFISHRLDEITALCDRVTVMRDGEYLGVFAMVEMTRERLIELMVGRALEAEYPRRQVTPGVPRLVVRNLCLGRRFQDISFTLRRGEVLGLTGLVGAGRTEVARSIFGAERPTGGSMELNSQPFQPRCPRHAIAAGIALLTEDRKSQGLVLGLSARENFGLPNLSQWLRFGWLKVAGEHHAFAQMTASLRIQLASPEQLAKNLSGGNQQKVVLAKWLQRQCDVILFDEPTRGIDVGAKYEVCLLINELAAQGKAILLISSELPEVMGMSDRILVMREGRITGEISHPSRFSQEAIMQLATG